jgi:hypothetical protein
MTCLVAGCLAFVLLPLCAALVHTALLVPLALREPGVLVVFSGCLCALIWVRLQVPLLCACLLGVYGQRGTHQPCAHESSCPSGSFASLRFVVRACRLAFCVQASVCFSL